MQPRNSMDKRHRFPPEIIQHAVWLYLRFNLSTRDVEDLLAAPGIAVSHETIRVWCQRFGPKYARRLRRSHHGLGTPSLSTKSSSESEAPNAFSPYTPPPRTSSIWDAITSAQTIIEHFATVPLRPGNGLRKYDSARSHYALRPGQLT